MPYSHIFSQALSAIIQDMCMVAHYAAQRGWAEMNAGNMSIDVTDLIQEAADTSRYRKISFPVDAPACADRYYLVTRAGSRFRDLADEPSAAILLIHVLKTLDQYVVIQGGGTQGAATSELATHLKIQAHHYQIHKQGAAVFHTHPTHLIALTHIKTYCNKTELDRLLWSMHPEVALVLPEGVGFVPFHEPGSDELAIATHKAMTDLRFIIWEKHGCVSISENIKQAFDLVDICNKAAEIFFLSSHR